MLQRTALTAILVGAICGAGIAQKRIELQEDLGIGLAVGQPSGVNIKYWLSATEALDLAAGYHFNRNADLHSDFMVHSYLVSVPEGWMLAYVGLGGRVTAGDGYTVGLRWPIGLTYLPFAYPIDIYVEFAPVLNVAPELGLDSDGFVGVRYYFARFM
jgi:hypothetical protein